MAETISSSELFGKNNIVSSKELFGKKKGLWDRYVEATGKESEMMGSPANAEILRTAVGGGAAWIPAGIIKAAGIVSGQREGGDALADFVQEKIVGTPSTDVGKLAQKQIAYPFEKLSEKSQEYADIVYDKTGSPILATATRVAGEALPFVLPFVAGKGLKAGVKAGKRVIEPPSIDLGKVSEKPLSITPETPRSERVSPEFTKSVLTEKEQPLKIEQKKDFVFADKDSELIERQADMFEEARTGKKIVKTKELQKETPIEAKRAKEDIAPAEKVEPTANVEPLITEARKYKTAEEFVKAQGEPLYHSTRTENIPSINQKGFTGDIGEMSGKTGGKMEKGVFLYGDKESADIFGKNFKDSSTVEAKVNGKIYDANSESKYGWEDDLQIQEIAKDKKIINQLRKDGYVGVNSVELGTPATFVFEPKTIKTKSQLTSIWNKAQEAPKAEIKPEMPVEGKPAKAALDINKELVEKGFEGIPERELARYNPIQKVEEVSKAQALVSNPDFFEMAKGNKPLPEDVHPQVLFNVAINEATKAGNIDMLMDLAKSPIAEQRSLAAQQLGASGWEKPINNIVKTIQEVKKGRESKIRSPQIKEKVRKVLNEEVKKINLSKEELSWDRFLDKIVC